MHLNCVLEETYVYWLRSGEKHSRPWIYEDVVKISSIGQGEHYMKFDERDDFKHNILCLCIFFFKSL